MDRRQFCLRTAGVLAAMPLANAGLAQTRQAADQIKLIVRADDIGSAHAANVACIRSFRDGIARSVEVMAPCPWFNEAVAMLRETPGYDVGVHLTLTSEWANYKWGPITQSPSLVDSSGYFFATNRDFLAAKWDIHEVEKELRAQIELAKKHIAQVTHLSSHMGTPTSTPELQTLVRRLAAEYKLPIETPGAQWFRWPADNNTAAEQREAALVKALEELKPGIWVLVEHPGLDTDEMRAIGHEGYGNVAAHRDGVTRSFTSERVKEVIKERSIQLVSYGQIWPGKQ